MIILSGYSKTVRCSLMTIYLTFYLLIAVIFSPFNLPFYIFLSFLTVKGACYIYLSRLFSDNYADIRAAFGGSRGIMRRRRRMKISVISPDFELAVGSRKESGLLGLNNGFLSISGGLGIYLLF